MFTIKGSPIIGREKTGGPELFKITERGFQYGGAMTHLKLEEFFTKRPALNAVLAGWAAGDVPYTIANRDFEVLGTNMTTALCTFATPPITGITLTTAGADADQAILTPHLDTAQSLWAVVNQWKSNYSPRFEAWIRTGAAITKQIVQLGFQLTNAMDVDEATITDADLIVFRYSSEAASNPTYWKCVSSRGGVDVIDALRSIPAVAADTWYHFVITIDSNLKPHIYVNGYDLTSQLSAAGQAALVTAKAFIPYIGIAGNGTAPGAKAMSVRYLSCSRLAA